MAHAMNEHPHPDHLQAPRGYDDIDPNHYSAMDWPMIEPRLVWPIKKPEVPTAQPESGPLQLALKIMAVFLGVAALTSLIFFRLGDKPVPININFDSAPSGRTIVLER